MLTNDTKTVQKKKGRKEEAQLMEKAQKRNETREKGKYEKYIGCVQA